MRELVYLYIGDIGTNIKECGIEFSNQYKVFYDRNNRTIHIEKKTVNSIINYGENINNLKLLVGKNGVGKSTILDLLGTSKRDRDNEFPTLVDTNYLIPAKIDKYNWFILYHLHDNVFVIEGYDLDTLIGVQNVNGRYPWEMCAVIMEYDFKCNCVSNIYPLQEYTYFSEKANKMLFYLFYQINPDIEWLEYPLRCRSNDRGNDFFEREYVNRIGFEAITRYLYKAIHDDVFSNSLQSKIGVRIDIELKIENGCNTSDMYLINGRTHEAYKKTLEEVIYGNKEEILNRYIPERYSTKEWWNIQYLETVLWRILSERIYQPQKQYDIKKAEVNNYKYRKKFLLDFLKQLIEEDKKNYNYTICELDYKIIETICEEIEKIPDKYFINYRKISIEMKNVDSYFMKTLIKNVDLEGGRIKQTDLINISFRNLSSGEAFYLDFYASLYCRINKMKNFHSDNTCILLLDEPDRCFHPEWSRRFIKNLTKTLTSEPFNKFNYQIIIATHSPLLLSDVLKEDIICLNTTEDGNIRVEKAPYGFMSNINDILLDSFFMEAPYGAWAEEYVNKLIKQINEISLNIKNEQDIEKVKAEIEQLEKKVEVIGEELIRDSLLKKLKRLKYKIIEKNTLRKNREEEIKYLEERLKMLREND